MNFEYLSLCLLSDSSSLLLSPLYLLVSLIEFLEESSELELFLFLVEDFLKFIPGICWYKISWYPLALISKNKLGYFLSLFLRKGLPAIWALSHLEYSKKSIVCCGSWGFSSKSAYKSSSFSFSLASISVLNESMMELPISFCISTSPSAFQDSSRSGTPWHRLSLKIRLNTNFK